MPCRTRCATAWACSRPGRCRPPVEEPGGKRAHHHRLRMVLGLSWATTKPSLPTLRLLSGGKARFFPSPLPAASPAGGEGGERSEPGEGCRRTLMRGDIPLPRASRGPSPSAGEAAGRGEGKEEALRPHAIALPASGGGSPPHAYARSSTHRRGV